MTSLKKAIVENKLEEFIAEREPMDAPKETVARYIDASAIPLESSKEGRSKSDVDRFGGCK